MKVSSRFTFDKVRFDQENNNHLVLTLEAPKLDWQKKRPPVLIFMVVDVSGSMAGDKLQYAKQSAIKLVDHLQPGDFAGLITFATEVRMISAPAEMTQIRKDELKAKIGDLRDHDSTNFSDAMLMALDHVSGMKDLPDGMARRVIMFTDGQANAGCAVDHDKIVGLLDTRLGKCSVSAFGYGAGANQELLTDLARKGAGNYAFIKNPDDAMSAFAKELGGLLSTYAQDLVVEVTPHNGHTITEVISDVDAEQDGKTIKVKLPNIMSEEVRNIVFDMKLSAQTKALPREMVAVNVEIKYNVLDEKGTKSEKTVPLKSKVRFVKSGEEQDKPTREVDVIVGLAQMVKAQIEAESAASRGDYATAGQIMRLATCSLESRGHGSLGRKAKKLGATMDSYASWQGSNGYRTSMKNAMTRSYGTSSMDSDALIDITDIGISGSNSAQDLLIAEFAKKQEKQQQASVPAPAPIAPVPAPTSAPKTSSTVSKKRSRRW